MANMGTIDRTLRIIVAVAIFAFYFAGIITGTLAIVLLSLGAIFLLTSLVSVCPLYMLFGINTCPREHHTSK